VGLLKVFLGSTFRELKDERKEILDKLESALTGVGIETAFVPDGRSSQEIGIEALRSSDVAVFLVSPEYGSLIDECKIGDCIAADCPMKKKLGKISYTHCEYKVALAENKSHQAYLVGKDWAAVDKLSGWDGVNWEELWGNPAFDGLGKEDIKRLSNVAKKASEFKKEARLEFCPAYKDGGEIAKHLATNIIEWHAQGRIKLKNFCGRRAELKDLLRKMDESVEVCGVGGVGKTTLIHIALLIQKLKGKKPLTLGTSQSYVTGSGYAIFREKCRESQHEIIGDKITLDDISDALAAPEEVRKKEKGEKIKELSSIVERQNIVLFIDDFQLADGDAQSFVKSAKGTVISSRKGTGLARKEVPLIGVAKGDRKELVELIAGRLNKKLSNSAKQKIEDIAEGHPVSTEIIVRNCDKIDFEQVKEYKSGLDFSDAAHVEEFLRRVVKDILRIEAFDLLKNLSLINMEVGSNIDKMSIEKSFGMVDFKKVFAELIDAGMLEKKEKQESTYRFVFRHIQEAIKDDSDKQGHGKIVEYYKNKMKRIGKKYEDMVEVLFHLSKSDPSEQIIGAFL